MSSAKATDAQLSADAPLADAMTISGNVGAIPVLNLKHPLSPVDKVIKDELVKGTGRALVKGQGIATRTWLHSRAKTVKTPPLADVEYAYTLGY